MSITSTSRGRHSTGFCFIPQIWGNQHKLPEPQVIRTVGSPFSIIHSVEGAEALTKGNATAAAIFGHNRHATRGSVKVSNAHPFVEGDWVLVHNGTLYGGVDMADTSVEVDSHALCKKIDQVGIKDALMGLYGAFAIIAYNKHTGEVYAARNGERDLHYFEHRDYSYVMSDQIDLHYVLRKTNRYLRDEKSGETGLVTIFKEHVLYKLTDTGFKEIDSVQPKSKVVSLGYNGGSVQDRPFRPTHSGKPAVIGKPIPTVPKEKIKFRVSALTELGRTFKYDGYTMMGERVVFYTNSRRGELLGKLGEGYVTHLVRDVATDQYAFQVKYRNIEWDIPLAGSKDKVETVAACEDCADPIVNTDNAIKLLNGGFLCSSCISHFQTYGHNHRHIIDDGVPIYEQ